MSPGPLASFYFKNKEFAAHNIYKFYGRSYFFDFNWLDIYTILS